MAKGDVVWCDLSAYRIAEARAFYTRHFGWIYDRIVQSDGSPYDVASTSAGEAAGLFEMPKKFQEIGLPSFWMPYFAVDSAETACNVARSMGGKVEIGPLVVTEGESIALIRDPLGAGFTVYEGTALKPRGRQTQPGHMAWCALHVSDAKVVAHFYEALFGWQITQDSDAPYAYGVTTAQGTPVADIFELGEEIRGPFQFWGIHFAVSNVPQTQAEITESGGTIVYEDDAWGRATVLANDRDGAAFFLCGAPST